MVTSATDTVQVWCDKTAEYLLLTWQPYSEDAVAYWYYFLGDRRVNYYSNLRAPLPVYEPNIWLNPTLSISWSFLYCTDSNNLHNMFRNLSIKLQISIKQTSTISCSTSRSNADVTNRQFCDSNLFKFIVTVCRIKTTNKKQRLFM